MKVLVWPSYSVSVDFTEVSTDDIGPGMIATIDSVVGDVEVICPLGQI